MVASLAVFTLEVPRTLVPRMAFAVAAGALRKLWGSLVVLSDFSGGTRWPGVLLVALLLVAWRQPSFLVWLARHRSHAWCSGPVLGGTGSVAMCYCRWWC